MCTIYEGKHTLLTHKHVCVVFDTQICLCVIQISCPDLPVYDSTIETIDSYPVYFPGLLRV